MTTARRDPTASAGVLDRIDQARASWTHNEWTRTTAYNMRAILKPFGWRLLHDGDATHLITGFVFRHDDGRVLIVAHPHDHYADPRRAHRPNGGWRALSAHEHITLVYAALASSIEAASLAQAVDFAVETDPFKRLERLLTHHSKQAIRLALDTRWGRPHRDALETLNALAPDRALTNFLKPAVLTRPF